MTTKPKPTTRRNAEVACEFGNLTLKRAKLKDGHVQSPAHALLKLTVPRQHRERLAEFYTGAGSTLVSVQFVQGEEEWSGIARLHDLHLVTPKDLDAAPYAELSLMAAESDLVELAGFFLAVSSEDGMATATFALTDTPMFKFEREGAAAA